jgi:putative ABC transport system permease protein
MRFLRLFHHFILRDIAHSPLRAVLSVFGIALGIGVVAAVQLANERAIGSFNESLNIFNGQADLQISANGLSLNEQMISKLSWIWELGSLSAVVEGRGRLADVGGDEAGQQSVYIYGVDFLSEAPFRKYVTDDERDLTLNISRDEFVDLLLDPQRIVIPDALANRAGAKKNSMLPILVGDSLQNFVVGAILRTEGVARAFAGDAIFMDIAAAQLALGKVGQIDRIDVLLREKALLASVESRLREQLPANAIVYRPDSTAIRNEKLLRAFRYNLTALSYVALTVGIILVYNTVMIAVVRRRPEIGMLRALGISRRTVCALFLLEASVFGFLGSVAGLGLGYSMSTASGALVSQTVQNLYTGFFRSTYTNVGGFRFMAEAVFGGTVLALLSGTAPALRATAISPAAVLREGVLSPNHLRPARTAGLISAIVVAVGILLSFGPPVGGFPFLGYAAALCFVVGLGFATPWVVRVLVKTCAYPMGTVSPIIGKLAVQSMQSGIRRVTVAVFSLAIAVAMLASVATMVASFRNTIVAWVNQTLRADLYIRPAAAGPNEWASTFNPDSLTELRAVPSVAAVDRFRGRELNFGDSTVVLASGEFAVLRDHGQLLFVDGRSIQQVAADMIDQDRIIVSEPFSIKQGFKRGDFIQLPTADGTRPFQIEAVFYDYSNDRGLLVMDRSTYLRWFRDSTVTNVAIYLQPEADPTEAERAIAERLSNSHLRILTNSELKQQVLRVFDQTFQITYGLEAIAITVAVLGIANMLAALIFERRTEFAVLRFVGTDSRQLRRVVLTEAGITGMIGIIAGTGLGLALSALLVYVINRQSFGWTIQFGVPISFLVQSLAVVFAATVLAGIYPAMLAQRLDAIKSIRAE